MKAYQVSRAIAEGHLAQSEMTHTVIRPWYVLGPGHRWPIVLKPFYWIAERRASTRAAALRLGLVTIDQMVATLALVVAAPPRSVAHPDRPRHPPDVAGVHARRHAPGATRPSRRL